MTRDAGPWFPLVLVSGTTVRHHESRQVCTVSSIRCQHCATVIVAPLYSTTPVLYNSCTVAQCDLALSQPPNPATITKKSMFLHFVISGSFNSSSTLLVEQRCNVLSSRVNILVSPVSSPARIINQSNFFSQFTFRSTSSTPT